MLDQLLFSNTTLPEVTLTEMIEIPISGLLSGVLTDETYIVTGEISVQNGDSLIIESGAVFLFDGHYVFDIYGYLYAVGTETDSIKFMASLCAPNWRGIDFNSSADDSSRLEYCCITGSNSKGIYCSYSSPTIVNAIVEGNAGSGGIYFYDPSETSIIFGDFYNNGGGNFTGDPPPFLGLLVTVNANADSCDAYFNIFEDPLFVDPGNGYFHLQQTSPCIDAGDPNSPPDPDGTVADIEAFYFHQYWIILNPWELDLGEVSVGDSSAQMMWVINNSDTIAIIYRIEPSDSAFTTN
jgi:hypothetical protein